MQDSYDQQVKKMLALCRAVNSKQMANAEYDASLVLSVEQGGKTLIMKNSKARGFSVDSFDKTAAFLRLYTI